MSNDLPQMQASNRTALTRLAEACCAWSERWFPDAYAFALLAVGVLVVLDLCIGVEPSRIASSFGDGFWSVVPFTMQMCFIVIGGFVVADSAPIARLVGALAAIPRSGKGGVALVAAVGMLTSLVHWGLSLVIASLLARALARRADLHMDYRAAGAASCLGTGSVWALGLSSSAAQLQANPASMPAAILKVTGVIPFTETLFLWQSMLVAVVMVLLGTYVAWVTAPAEGTAQTAEKLGVKVALPERAPETRKRPGEWLEYSPALTLLIVLLAGAWLVGEFRQKGVGAAIANLNTYNLLFLTAGMLLHWRPRNFVASVGRAVPNAAGVLIQFPFLGAMSALMTTATTAGGQNMVHVLSGVLTSVASAGTFAPLVALYSAFLGLFVPSGGGKWLIEAPYVMQAARDLHYHLGWTVQIYNAAEALPNLINPFWMLPVLGILGLKARDLIGFTLVQFMVNLPVVLVLLWWLGRTLAYVPPH